jgi:hypothetical protein
LVVVLLKQVEMAAVLGAGELIAFGDRSQQNLFGDAVVDRRPSLSSGIERSAISPRISRSIHTFSSAALANLRRTSFTLRPTRDSVSAR